MGTAARIRSYRVRAGKSAGELAQQLGLNESWYFDLEHRDEELAATLTLFQAIELAAALGVRLRDLFSDNESREEAIPLLDLPSRIEAHVARNGASIAQFEEEVGWPLGEFLRSPISVAAESPLAFLQAIAEPLGMNWLSFVPDGDATEDARS
jgi:transcriptional regulator with XRE-family HTH domain